MSQPVDTAEGSGEDDEMKAWLNHHNLSKYANEFKRDQFKLKEFLDYNDDDIKDICESYNIRNPYKKRFINAVKQYQKSNNNDNSNDNTISSKIRTVVMSIKESESMKSLQTKLDEIDVFIQNNTTQTAEILNKTKSSENEIEAAFVLFENKLKERKKALNIQLNEESNTYLNTLKQEQDQLVQYKEAIQNAQKQQQSLLMDEKLDASKREIKMNQISQEVLNNDNNENNTNNISADFKSFVINSTEICQYISNIGSVEKPKCDPPSVQVTNISFNSVKIILESKENDDDKSGQFKLKYQNENDDEKKDDTDWTEVDVNNKQYELENLKQDTKYSLCGKYKFGKKEWSDYSQQIQFSTQKQLDPYAVTSYSAERFVVTQNNTVIKSKNGGCGSYFIYGPNNNGSGYNKSVHCWSMKRHHHNDCYRSIGITTCNNQDLTVNVNHWTSTGTNYYIKYTQDWEDGEIITVKLDCNAWTVTFYRNNEQFKSDAIKQNISYYFAFSSCERSGNHLECVPTPSSYYS